MDDATFNAVFLRSQNMAKAKAMLAQGSNPDEASEAIELGNDSGYPPSLINADLDGFKQRYAGNLASDIVQSNPHLQQFLNADPLYAQATSDDLHNLHQVSQANDRYNAQGSRPWYSVLARGVAHGMAEGGTSTLDAIGYITGSKELRNVASQLNKAMASGLPMSDEEQRSLSAKIGSALGGLADIVPFLFVGGPIGLALGATQMGLASGDVQLKEAEAKGGPAGAAFLGGAATGAALGLLPLHNLMKAGTIGGKMLTGGATMVGVGEAQEFVHQMIARGLYDPSAQYSTDLERMIASGVAGGALGGLMGAYMRVGKKPPDGLDKTVDDAKKEEAKEGSEAWKAQRAAQAASETAKRSPFTFRQFLEMRPGKVGISYEGLLQLYGEDKVPTPGDGLLGDVPEVVDGFARAMASKSHIDVPTATWMDKVPKELETPELIKDLIHSKDGVSENQAKENDELRKAVEQREVKEKEAVSIKKTAHPVGGVHWEVKRGEEVLHSSGNETAARTVYEKELLSDAYDAVHTASGLDPLPLTPLEGAVEPTPEAAKPVEAAKSGEQKMRRPREIPNYRVEISPNGTVEVFDGATLRFQGSKAAADNWLKQALTPQPKAPPKPGEPAKRSEDRTLEEKVTTGGLPVRLWNKLKSMAIRQQEQKYEYINKVMQAQLKKKFTKEWRAMEDEIRPQVREEVNERPIVRLDRFIREGRLMGAKISGKSPEGTILRPAINEADLTGEHKAQLVNAPAGSEYVSKSSGRRMLFTPDELARMFDFESGDAMIRELGESFDHRLQNVLGPEEWINKLVKDEIQSQLEAKHGSLDDMLLKELAEHFVGSDTLDRLAEEAVKLGIEGGADEAGVRMEVAGVVKNNFDTEVMKNVSSNKYLAAAARAGKRAFEFATNGKFLEAYKEKQAQLIAMHYAKQSIVAEKKQASLEQFLKSFSERSKDSMPQEYMDWIHVLMTKVGAWVNRTDADLLKELQARSTSQTFNIHDEFSKFLDRQENENYDIYMPTWLELPFTAKNIYELNVKQMDQVLRALKSMEFNGRDQQRLELNGQKRDFLKTLGDVIGVVENSAAISEKADGEGILGKLGERAWGLHAGLMQTEQFFKRLHRGDKNGILMRFAQDAASASNHEARMIRELSQDYIKLGKELNIDPKEMVGVSPFRGRAGRPMQFTRGNLLTLLLNTGTHSNWDKLLKGEFELRGGDVKATKALKGFETEVENFINSKATAKDFEFRQRFFDLLKKYKVAHDNMMRNMTGVAVEELTPMTWAHPVHGKFEGSWYPMEWDPNRLKPGGREQKLENTPTRAGTPKRHTKERTDYYAPVNFDLDASTGHLSQFIADIAFRPFVKEFGKIAYHNDFQQALNDRWGKQFGSMVKTWLEDIAGMTHRDSRVSNLANGVGENLRVSMTSALIGLNPGTLMKHTGTAAIQSIQQAGLPFFKEFATMWSGGGWESRSAGQATAAAYHDAIASGKPIPPDAQTKNFWFALDSSEELSGRHSSHFNPSSAADKVMRRMNITETLARVGSTPVAFGDLASAVPMWLAVYKREFAKAVKAGMDEKQAHAEGVRLGDFAVRDSHGSTRVSSRPELMRQQGISRWLTSLYSFFNHIYQRQYEIAWRSAEAGKKAYAGDLRGAMEDIPKITAMSLAYVIVPALIEEIVTPLTNKEKESWGMWAGKTLLKGTSASVPVVRDYAHGMMTGHDPSAGLFGSAFQYGTDLFRDLEKPDAFKPRNQGKMIQHTAELAGLFTGFPVQLGKTVKFLYNYEHGYEHPQGLIQWPGAAQHRRSFLGGMRWGTAEPPRR